MSAIYVDLRAAARILLREPGVVAPAEKAIVTSSTVLEIEIQRMLERLRVSGALREASYAAKRRESRALLGAMHLFPLGDEVLELARNEYPFPVLALDSLHIATAQLVAREAGDLEFWTHDAGVAAAALHRGLTVQGVEPHA